MRAQRDTDNQSTDLSTAERHKNKLKLLFVDK